jgi:hypothetical protein
MDLTSVQDRLLKGNYPTQDIDSAVTSITANIKSFTYANESLDSLAIFLVFKNTGGCRIFKTIDGNIVIDKLDLSYSESRELLGLGNWNLKKAYRLSFCPTQQIVMREVDAKEIHKAIFALVEPTTVKYVAGVEAGNFPTTITADCVSHKGLTYKQLKDCLLSSYRNSLKKHGVSVAFETEPSFYVVSFATD